MPEQRRARRIPYWRLLPGRWLATVICSLAISTWVFGLSGFAWQYRASTAILDGSQQPDAPKPPSRQDWSIPIFKTVQLFLLNSGTEDDASHPSNWMLIVGRLSAAALFLVISSTVILRVLDEVRRLPFHLTRKDHVVICGLGQTGLQLLDDLEVQGRVKSVVIIENNPANAWLDYARSMGATVVIGDSTRPNTLIEARAPQAREIFVVNGDDGVNLEVTAELGILLSDDTDRAKPLRLYVHIDDTNFATTLRPYSTILHDTPHMLVQVFNLPRTAAARLVTHQLWPHAPKKPEEVAHYVILGFGPMGQALAVQLAQLGHFPNRKRSRFTIADQEINKLASAFLSRFSRFTSWNDQRIGVDSFSADNDHWSCNSHPLPDGLGVNHPHAIQYASNAEFIDLPAGRSDERFAGKLARHFEETGVKPVIFICGQQDQQNFEAAAQLREQLSVHDRADVPIFVWLPSQPALAEILSRSKAGRFFPFGEYRSAASYEEVTAPIHESIGQVIHDDYEQQAINAGYRQNKEPWSALRDDFRESNHVAADHLIIKLATLGLKLRRSSESPTKPVDFDRITTAQAQLLAEMEHCRWVAERLLAGWRYAPEGQTKAETEANKKRKLNHNLIAWEFLGPERKMDFEQVRTVLRECQKEQFCLEESKQGNVEVALI